MTKIDDIERILRHAVIDDVIYCDNCGAMLEADIDKCYSCGWINPLRELGFI
jgi:hypothetical protein